MMCMVEEKTNIKNIQFYGGVYVYNMNYKLCTNNNKDTAYLWEF